MYYIILYYIILYLIELYSILQYSTILYYILQYNTIPQYTLQYTLQYAVQHCTILYRNLLHLNCTAILNQFAPLLYILLFHI